MGQNPSPDKKGEHPIVGVSWNDVQGFLERLSTDLMARTTLSSSFSNPTVPPEDSGWSALSMLDDEPLALRFRLPTEAEWEYACRAGTTSAYFFGDAFDAKHFNDRFGTVVEVRSFPPNPWGLYEMHGNVWEWCQDWYGDYPREAVVDPAGPATGGWRVLRGGGWIGDARDLRSAYRTLIVPGARVHAIGFRLALGPEVRQAEGGQRAGSETGPSAQGASGSERKARTVRSRGSFGRG